MKPAVVRTASVLRRLGAAIPDAWRDDALFRWASIGAALCLLMLLAGGLGGGVGRGVPSAAPGTTASSPALPSPASHGPAAPAVPPAEVPRIAPGRPLNSAVVLPGRPDADRFGTVAAPHAPPGSP
jgi:hypothetical protein